LFSGAELEMVENKKHETGLPGAGKPALRSILNREGGPAELQQNFGFAGKGSSPSLGGGGEKPRRNLNYYSTRRKGGRAGDQKEKENTPHCERPAFQHLRRPRKREESSRSRPVTGVNQSAVKTAKDGGRTRNYIWRSPQARTYHVQGEGETG